MRRRNRKKNLYANTVPVPVAGLAVLVASLALGYLWMVCRCQTLGRELAQLEARREALIKDEQQELFKWTRLKSPQSLERALAAAGIAMTWPANRQIVRLRRNEIEGAPWDEEEGRQVAGLRRGSSK